MFTFMWLCIICRIWMLWSIFFIHCSILKYKRPLKSAQKAVQRKNQKTNFAYIAEMSWMIISENFLHCMHPEISESKPLFCSEWRLGLLLALISFYYLLYLVLLHHNRLRLRALLSLLLYWDNFRRQRRWCPWAPHNLESCRCDNQARLFCQLLPACCR